MDENREEIVEQTTDSEESRRDFIAKAAGIVGAALVGGMAAALTSSSPAEGAMVGRLPAGALKINQLNNGAKLSIPASHLATLFDNEAFTKGPMGGKNMDVGVSLSYS